MYHSETPLPLRIHVPLMVRFSPSSKGGGVKKQPMSGTWTLNGKEVSEWHIISSGWGRVKKRPMSGTWTLNGKGVSEWHIYRKGRGDIIWGLRVRGK